MNLPPSLNAARFIYRLAKEDLGPDLGGFSVTDLIADNFPGLTLSEVREIVGILTRWG